MSTKRFFGKSVMMTACLAVVALTSGCGFFCTNDSQCGSNICRVPLCAEKKTKIEDAELPPEFTEFLVALFSPTELQP